MTAAGSDGQPCGDPLCPDQDGDVCHYVATETTPAIETDNGAELREHMETAAHRLTQTTGNSQTARDRRGAALHVLGALDAYDRGERWSR